MRALGISVTRHPLEGTGLVPEPKKIHWVDSPNYRALCELLYPDVPRVAAWAFHGKVCWAQVIQVQPTLIALSEQRIDPDLVVGVSARSRAQIIYDFHFLNPYGYLIIDE